MGAVLSSARDAFLATKNHVQRRLNSPDASAADWSGLPHKLLLIIMESLDVPGLVRSGAVCTSWHSAYATFRRLRLPSPKQGPCLLYACEEYGPNHAAMYCPSTRTTFRVPFPGPPHSRRGARVFSSRGWVFTADELGDPHLLNLFTGAKAPLPPVKTLPGVEGFLDDEGKHVFEEEINNLGDRIPAYTLRARHWAFHRVAISGAGDDISACTVLAVHMWDMMLSYARPGDDAWTPLSGVVPQLSDFYRGKHFDNVIYNEEDGLFYALQTHGEVYTLDLNGPSPVVTQIMGLAEVARQHGNESKYLVFAPWGDLLQVWRFWLDADYRVNQEDGDTQGVSQADEPQSVDEPTILVDDLGDEVATLGLMVFKVDTNRQELVKLSSIEDHALILGYNSASCIPTTDFPAFKPNCAYLTDDCHEYCHYLQSDLGIWDIQNNSMEFLGDAWPDLYSWLDCPAPVWITPSFC